MSWLWPSLIAPALLTAVVFIDKYVLTKRVKNPLGVPLYQPVAATAFAGALTLFHFGPDPGLRNALLIMSAGALGAFGAALYFQALSRSQTSNIVAYLQVQPIFTLVMAIAILGETLTRGQGFGFALILSAVLGLAFEDQGKLRPGRAFYEIMGGNLLFALASILIKLTSNLHAFATILEFESWGVVVAGVALFAFYPQMRREFLASLRISGGGTLAIMFGNEALYILSKAVTFLAITLGPVALVSALAGTQVFYGLAFGLLLSLWFPLVFHERTDRKTFLKRAALMMLLFLGIVAVQT
jgi:uncharacterized membrane protein